ncbi:hypothetical protein HY571_00720, partial [Candidatus Micrarchaeota archaeon]|nr:hypothetical protein [Candidatus Micrarchaeota archaeon]
MEIEFSDRRIAMDKELNSLDKLVIRFCEKLKKNNIRYCLVSGYVAIVFGRSRATEDVDIITERMPREKFAVLWKDILTEFECVNEDDENKVYNEFLLNNDSIRFSEPGKPMPNIELKFEHKLLDKYSLENALKFELNGHLLYISPLELQIAYKLYLGSDKDIEDATH